MHHEDIATITSRTQLRAMADLRWNQGYKRVCCTTRAQPRTSLGSFLSRSASSAARGLTYYRAPTPWVSQQTTLPVRSHTAESHRSYHLQNLDAAQPRQKDAHRKLSFAKINAFWKNPEKKWLQFSKIKQNSDKIFKNFQNLQKKNQQKFQHFLTKKLRVENGAKECIV